MEAVAFYIFLFLTITTVNIYRGLLCFFVVFVVYACFFVSVFEI